MIDMVSERKEYKKRADAHGFEEQDVSSFSNSLSFSETEYSTVRLAATQAVQHAALACVEWIGKGDEKNADQAAVTAMRLVLNKSDIAGKIVIGEGERDEAPMLHLGEVLGQGGVKVDIAVDPLEGTTICAEAAGGALSVIACAPQGGIISAPDLYMQKIVVGYGLPDGVVNLDDDYKNNLTNLAKAKGCAISDLSVAILKRERHQEMIAKIRELGARVKLLMDGDIMAAISTALPSTSMVDMYIGIGGAPEGVLAAAALKCLGGQMQGKLLSASEQQKVQANEKYTINTLVPGDVIFAATGVTSNWLLEGIRVLPKVSPFACLSNAIVMSTAPHSVEKIATYHNFKQR